MFATDVLKVLYQPHKVFKKIVQDPKYWGPLLVIIIFTAAQTAFLYSQYSRTYYEQTSPNISELTLWTTNATYWSASSDTAILVNDQDFFSSVFYNNPNLGNGSIQFALANNSSLSMELKNFTSVKGSEGGFKDLYFQLKLVEPQTAPSSATVYLYSLSQTNYFRYDLTPSFASLNLTEWNNFTIPISSSNWQSSGSPTWNNVTGFRLDLSFPENTNITARIGGLFFRGLHITPLEYYTQAGFAANALLSALFTFVSQWLILSAVTYIVIKALKGQVTWKPLFIALGMASVVSAIVMFINIAATATLPAQIYYPFEFNYSYQLAYSPQVVTLFSAASQATYNSVIAPAIANATLIASTAAIAMYVWLTLLGAAVIRALTEFTWVKSLLGAGASVVLTFIILTLLYSFGIL